MGRLKLEVADVVRRFAARMLAQRGGRVSQAARRVLRSIGACRTSALGGHVDRCDRCGGEQIAYNSCRNRHCPKCQASARRTWIAKREAELLPVPYYHVVFTIPHELGPLAIANPKRVYEILFRTSAETLVEIAADPKHLGAQIGILSILHTWGQNLQHHPHVHCVVTGGGIAPDQSRWISCRDGFFLPVRVLSRVFRGKFLDRVRRAVARGELVIPEQLGELANPVSLREFLRPLYEKEWVVYAKAPFGGPERVLKYLGRYTHRVAIANSRLVAMDAESVSFVWKDYAHGERTSVMSLSGVEFLRRFLMHVLPKGLVRIRHAGFLANCHRKGKLAVSRRLLGVRAAEVSIAPAPDREAKAKDGAVCPVCREGKMIIAQRFEPGARVTVCHASSFLDTS